MTNVGVTANNAVMTNGPREKALPPEYTPPLPNNPENIPRGVLPAPPSYIEANAVPSTPPPKYETIYGKVKAAKTSSKGAFDFYRKLVTILSNADGFIIAPVIYMMVCISAIAMGSIHIGDCPAQNMIPICLVVGGCFWLTYGFIVVLEKYVDRKRSIHLPKAELNKLRMREKPFLFKALAVFCAAWFLATAVFVYITYDKYSPVVAISIASTTTSPTTTTAPTSTDTDAGNNKTSQTQHVNNVYCDGVLYIYAFSLVTSVFIVIAFVIFVFPLLIYVGDLISEGIGYHQGK